MRRFRVACSIVRMFYLVLAAIVTGHVGYDLVFNDQVAAVNPLLRLIGRKVIFYGHYPDLLLASRQPSLLRRLYRYPFDMLESLTTGMCDMVLVNSKFTAEAFCRTISSFRKAKPRVLYPPVSTEVEAFQLKGGSSDSDASFSELERFDLSAPFVVSLNRFEEKKDVELAIKAVARLPRQIKCNLIVAGGFDPRLPECNDYFQRLVKLSKELNFRVLGCEDVVETNAPALDNSGPHFRAMKAFEHVLVISECSVSRVLGPEGVDNATAWVYPLGGSFQVPCEAMFVGCLPVACNTGGPRETIVDRETGFLCPPTPESFSAALKHILLLSLENPEELAALRSKAQIHATNRFSPDVFRRSLKAIIEDVTGPWDGSSSERPKKV